MMQASWTRTWRNPTNQPPDHINYIFRIVKCLMYSNLCGQALIYLILLLPRGLFVGELQKFLLEGLPSPLPVIVQVGIYQAQR